MTERELKRLSRGDLLEMLLSLSRENEELRRQVEDLQAQLNDRMIVVENAGSLAEAALQLNGVFQAAQEACDQYIENIRRRSERQEQVCIQMEQETKQKCERMLAEAERKAGSFSQLFGGNGKTMTDTTQNEKL